MKGIIKKILARINSSIKQLLLFITFILFPDMILWAEEKVEIFPSAPYDRYIIYQALIFFWIGIIGLIVILKMKLKELERIQNMGINKEEKDIPYLD